MKLIEIAFEAELLLGPNAFQALDEFPAPTVSFCMVQPPLADRCELELRVTDQFDSGEGRCFCIVP